MEYIASFESHDIDGDDVDLRFDINGIDTGTNVSLVEQCGIASVVIKALIAEQEQLANSLLDAQKKVAELEASQLASNPATWVDEPVGDDEWSAGGRAMRNAISAVFTMKRTSLNDAIGVFNIGSETCADHFVAWTDKGRNLPNGVYWIYTAPVEASQLVVKLDSDQEPDPEVNPYDGENFYISGWNARGKADREKLRAAGITVQEK